MPWIVRLIKTPKVNDFRSDYFPRKLHYKRDAEELVREVEQKGGAAVLEPLPPRQPDPPIISLHADKNPRGRGEPPEDNPPQPTALDYARQIADRDRDRAARLPTLRPRRK
jgi:hypothetical protein